MGKRVVIAEDEAIIRLDLKEILEAEGYEVVGETGRGDEAVELVAQHQPDLAILDIKMPGIDGIEAARRISAEHRVAVLILTAFSQRNLIEEARDAGVAAYLVKPFQRGELVPAIDVAAARFEEYRAIEDEHTRLSEEVPTHEDKLETRQLVDRAKGVLMDDHGMAEAEAFSFIQRTAMDRRARMQAGGPGDHRRDPHPLSRPTGGAGTGRRRSRSALGSEAVATRSRRGALYLLDGNSLVFRAFFALPIDLATKAGPGHQRRARLHLDAGHAAARQRARAASAVAFDRPEPTFRDDIVEEYKGNRPETPDLLVPQFALVRDGARRPRASSWSRSPATRPTTSSPPWPPRRATPGATWWW